ncbi:MAG: hypothetical protein NAG76_18850 [Candidatus Pristimantibacillus lignocellulolyticus]|uniref:Uncharacterized protein n=1 Tax=Candidatus Pristimantibacillus lignocellulolyticus TaxID=2994561 RepID=A0A9J6ZD73_9BACL|nr:MAG: hypothetical protein NAG76_18850 [Candidatus Pristimantibacillus lignocellulolyticus]
MRSCLLLFFLFIVLSGCTKASSVTTDNTTVTLTDTTLAKQYGDLLDNIDYISIRSGNGDLFEIRQTDIINQWVQDVSTLPLAIYKETDSTVGTLYSVNLYSANELSVDFSTTSVNGYHLKSNTDLVNAINDLLTSTRIKSIVISCTEVCHQFMNEPFPELIFEDVHEIKVFEDAINYGLIDTREAEYTPLFHMDVTFNAGSPMEYHLNVADDVNIKNGLLLTPKGEAYVITEKITNELKLLLYKD